jgi:hypothetical protein
VCQIGAAYLFVVFFGLIALQTWYMYVHGVYIFNDPRAIKVRTDY